MESRFWQWYVSRPSRCLEYETDFRQEALDLLVQSINAGEITSLDGVDTPLSKRISAHHNLSKFEMNSNWVGSPQDWVCPCCLRSKFQISREGQRGQILAKLVVHHDHMSEAMKDEFHRAFVNAGTEIEQVEGLRLVEHMGSAFAAYEEVLICEDCNNADTEAKNQIAAPKYFSFSIGQIGQFIGCADHRPHQVNAGVAREIWRLAKPAYELRMKLIRVVAVAAATDAHWYEPYARGEDPIPIFGPRHRLGDHVIKKLTSSETLFRELSPKEKISTPNLSRWRVVPQKPGKVPPKNFLPMLRSDQTCARAWDALEENWRCPVCLRNKEQTVYVAEKGKVSFHTAASKEKGRWASAKIICNQCKSILMSLKLEVSNLVGETPSDSYGFVSPEELAKIINARPHSPHFILPAESAALVLVVVERLSNQS